MNQLRSLGAYALGLFVLGCAGNGSDLSGTPGGGGGGGGGGIPIVGNPSIEMISVSGFVPQAIPNYLDPLNIRTGEQVQFQLVGYSSTGQRVVLPGTEWRTSDTTNIFGVVAGNTGVFTAASRQTPVNQLISVRYNGQEFATEYSVRPRQARIIGSVLNRSTGLPIKGVLVYMFTTDGTYLGLAQTSYDGTFRASVPTTVGRFQIFNDSLPGNVMRMIQFNSDAALTLSKPNYLNNLNSSGVVVPVSVSQAGTQRRLTGVAQTCKPLIGSTSPAFNADYYLATPILAIPNGTDDTLNSEGCSVTP
jgi:hypothetical protein